MTITTTVSASAVPSVTMTAATRAAPTSMVAKFVPAASHVAATPTAAVFPATIGPAAAVLTK